MMMMMMNSVTTTTMTTTMGFCFSAGLGRADGCAERVFSPRNILMTLLLCFVSILKVSSLGRRREIFLLPICSAFIDRKRGEMAFLRGREGRAIAAWSAVDSPFT
jgi:hypothetical protein